MLCHLPNILLPRISNTSNFCLDTTKIQYFEFLFRQIFAKFAEFHRIFVHNADHFHPKIPRLFDENLREQRTKIVKFVNALLLHNTVPQRKDFWTYYTQCIPSKFKCRSFNSLGVTEECRINPPDWKDQKKPGLNRVHGAQNNDEIFFLGGE